MTYVLSLTYAPRAQLQDRMVLGQTDVVIGRNIDCHWVIDDPDCIVSGQHCIVSPSGDGYVVTDWSTNGLIVDGAHEPLGEGKSAELRDGTVLQLGDYVISVAVEAEDKVVAVEPVTIEAPRGLTPEALGLTSRSTEPAREVPSASSVPDRPTSAAQTPHEERAQPAMSDTAAQTRRTVRPRTSGRVYCSRIPEVAQTSQGARPPSLQWQQAVREPVSRSNQTIHRRRKTLTRNHPAPRPFLMPTSCQ